jgi:hypothetical protein
MTRSSIYFYLTLRRNSIHTCLVTYIYLVTYTGVCATEYRKNLHVPYLLSNVYNMVP